MSTKGSPKLAKCPFCGGEAKTLSQAPKGLGYSVGCLDNECRGFIALSWIYGTEAEAIAAWNTRAERTCEVLGEDYDELLDYWETELSCGHTYIGMRQYVNYCPNCGAKVVE